MFRITLLSLALSVSLLGNSPAAAGAMRSDLIVLQAADLRVARIGHRLLTSNARRCAKTMPGTGMVLHSLGQYNQAARPEAVALHGFLTPVSVAGIVPEGPASLAGLIPGDAIASINGVPLVPSTQLATANTVDRDQAEQRIWSLPTDAPIRFGVVRREGPVELVVTPVPACRVRLELVSGRQVKAQSDGKTIQLGQAFAANLTDEELAFAMAHELAHVILGHRTKLAAFETPLADKQTKLERARLARLFEDEADLLSLHLLASAGWDPAIAPRFMRGKGKKFGGGSRTHRKTSDRARLMEQEISLMPKSAQVVGAP